MVENITCQGIFRWIGQGYKRIKKSVNYTDITRERKIFYALGIPGASTLTDKQLKNQIIIDAILDEGLESEYLITDPQKLVGGFMSPATTQEQTDNPGMCVWMGWVDLPRYSRFTEPGEKDDPIIHNLTIKAAFRANGQTERLFDEAHGAFIQKYEYRVIDDRKE